MVRGIVNVGGWPRRKWRDRAGCPCTVAASARLACAAAAVGQNAEAGECGAQPLAKLFRGHLWRRAAAPHLHLRQLRCEPAGRHSVTHTCSPLARRAGTMSPAATMESTGASPIGWVLTSRCVCAHTAPPRPPRCGRGLGRCPPLAHHPSRGVGRRCAPLAHPLRVARGEEPGREARWPRECDVVGEEQVGALRQHQQDVTAALSVEDTADPRWIALWRHLQHLGKEVELGTARRGGRGAARRCREHAAQPAPTGAAGDRRGGCRTR